MKANREIQRQARQVFRHCQVDGRVSDTRLREVVDIIASSRPRGYLGILQALARLVRLDEERRRAVVECAVDAGPAFVESITKALRQSRGDDLTLEFRRNPGLLGGVRVRIGNDVWDHSVNARLESLARSI